MSKSSRSATKEISRKNTLVEIEAEFPSPSLPPSNTTGRFIVVYKDEFAENTKGIKSFFNKTGVKHMMTTSDFTAGVMSVSELNAAEGMNFEKLGIAVINDQENMLRISSALSDSSNPILVIEPEYISYPSVSTLKSSEFLGKEYMKGYFDAVSNLYNKMGEGVPTSLSGKSNIPFLDTDQYTWGIQSIGAHNSKFSGQGINVAVLDTGMDLTHPDFAGRHIVSESFSGVPVQDINGHGTHCIGTACGPQLPASGVRRYGVAYNAQVYIAKVFNNDPLPGAPTANILAALEWALNNNCHIASLSLGMRINQTVVQFETPIMRALKAGLLVIAAAGNNASRPNNPGFVEPPANTIGAMAVAALDNQLSIAPFSSQSSKVNGHGGIVNISAPGVDVFSCFPTLLGSHKALNGTSMATPHVAGVAALYAEATGERGSELWARLIQTAKPLQLSSMDAGSGLVQAP